MEPESDNNRIYITGLPPDITEDQLAEQFGGLGKVAKKKQKRGYPDQWPWKISIYKDDAGKCKGDATLTYEDPNAAQTAPNFFNDEPCVAFPDFKMKVELAAVKETPAGSYGGGGGGGGYGGGGGFGGGGYGGGGRGRGRGRGRGGDRYDRGGYNPSPYGGY